MTLQEIQAQIVAAANQAGIDPALALAVAQHESGFDPDAVGPTGDKGVFQISDPTAGDLGLTNPFDPVANIQAGVAYLSQLLTRYGGDVQTALMAYNGGMGNVDRGTVSAAAQAYPGIVLSLLSSAQSILASLGFDTGPRRTPGPASTPEPAD